MRAVSQYEIAIGKPLAWPVFDAAGKLLLGEGVVVSCQAQFDMICGRGHVHVGPRGTHRAIAPSAPHSKVHLLKPGSASPPAPVPVFDAVIALRDELARVHEDLLAVTGADLGERVIDLATRLRDLVTRDADAALAAMQLEASEDSHIPRQLHAAILCELAARARQLDPAQNLSIVAAALTFDVALGPIADKLNRQEVQLTGEQRSRIDAHPGDGVVLLQAGGVTDPAWLDAVLHHHERLDGSGYPHGLTGDAIGPEARMLAIVDIFSALVRPRAYRGAMHARLALRKLFLERGTAVDEALPGLLIKEIGVFPPGTLVRLANGEVGIVLRRGENAAHPLVARLVNANGTMAAVARQRDTARDQHAITGTVPQARYKGLLADIGGLWAVARSPA